MDRLKGFPTVNPVPFSILIGLLSVFSSKPAGAADGIPGGFPPAHFIGSPWDYGLSIGLTLLTLILAAKYSRFLHPKWPILGINLFLGLRYMAWRVLYTLNTQDSAGLAISGLLYGAEIYGFLSVILFYVQAARPRHRDPSPPKRDPLPGVDLLVTVSDEPPDILYRTLVACRAIDYPEDLKTVYVLDDGQREEIRKLSEELGCRYVTRETHEHAKAGNLNNGLRQSSAEFVMVLDCDHVPVRTFLRETLGFFDDPKVALVQTPHYFYNPDTFQRNLRLEHEIANEQDLFFYIIQPGRDTFNSAFYAGSGTVFRRSALTDIGGVQVQTVTEDLHTSLVLHSRGYRSVYLNRILTAGLSPESYRSYLKQRERWARGGIQVFILDNPLWKKGLTFMQRINYFGSIFYFFYGWARLAFLAAPLSFLLFGIPPLVSGIWLLLNYFLPYYITSLVAFNLISRRLRNPFWSDVYETVTCFSNAWTAILTVFKPEKIVFLTTPKGERFDQTRLDWAYVSPNLFMSALLLLGLGLGGYHFYTGGPHADAILISAFWSLYNLLILVAATVVARQRLQKRSGPRLERRIPCEVRFSEHRVEGICTDLSETGMSVSLREAAPLPRRVGVKLFSDFGETTDLEGEVVRNDLLPSGRPSIGIRFLNIGEETHRGLVRQMYCSPNSWNEVHRTASTTWRSFSLLASSAARAFFKERPLQRFAPRIRKPVACDLETDAAVYRGTTEDISHAGLSLRIQTRDDLPREVILKLHSKDGTTVTIRSEVVRTRETHGAEKVLGIRFLEPAEVDLSEPGKDEPAAAPGPPDR